jgi:ABC-type Zn uptake system ZnuABC Zn-binding protein ZnuA
VRILFGRGAIMSGAQGAIPSDARGTGVAGRRARPAVWVVAVVLVALVVAGCAGPAAAPTGPTPGPGAVKVVATTTILADMVQQVGGSRVNVTSLVPKGGDVHTFDPRPSSLRAVADASLIVRNGLGLDDWLAGLVSNSGSSAPVIAAAEDLAGVTYLPGEGGPGTVNPHVWMNPAYAAEMAATIADALTTADPAGADAYARGLAAYRQELAALDADSRARMEAIPVGDRTVISFHDAFPYFADAYGLQVDGTIVSAPGQDPSAGTVADLITAIRAHGVSAVFTEAQFNDELARMIADETGIAVISDLYTDTVGDPPQDTYAGLMRWNVDRVTRALAGG